MWIFEFSENHRFERLGPSLIPIHQTQRDIHDILDRRWQKSKIGPLEKFHTIQIILSSV